MLLQEERTGRQNNFNLIRIYLSLSVVFFHSYELSQQEELSFLNSLFNADRAVQAFFIISGYLVMKSYLQSSSLKDFLIRRVRRIYPAYFTIIVVCTIMGALVTTYPVAQYFMSAELYRYLFANLCFLNFIQPSLPGVFTGNFLTAVNGSLWTLKIEVAYYLFVPIIVLFRTKINVHLLYAILFLSSLGYLATMKYLSVSHHNNTWLFLSRQLPGELFYFILGAWVLEFQKERWFKVMLRWIGLPCLLLLFLPLSVVTQSLLTAIVVFFLAYAIPVINYPAKEQDISYGLYIVHFPVIQVLVYYQSYSYSGFTSLLWTLAITIILALISWLYIEKPFMTKKITP